MRKILLIMTVFITSSSHIAAYFANDAIANSQSPNNSREQASSSSNNQFTNLPPNTEVHVIGTYNKAKGVNITRENVPIILVLTSYEEANWWIRKTDNVNLVGVIVSGYRKQSITGLDPSIKIVNISYYSYSK